MVGFTGVNLIRKILGSKCLEIIAGSILASSESAKFKDIFRSPGLKKIEDSRIQSLPAYSGRSITT